MIHYSRLFATWIGLAVGLAAFPCLAQSPAAKPARDARSAASATSSVAANGTASGVRWQTPNPEDVKTQVFAWLGARRIDAALVEKINAIWATPINRFNDEEVLARLAATYAVLDARAAKLVDFCSQPRKGGVAPPREEWLRDPSIPTLFSNNLRLFYARWLVSESLFDEALEQLTGLEPSQVMAPASLLFYEGVVYHASLNKEAGLKSLEELLQGADSSPKRYIAVAKLMQEDLKELKEESLDHIARRMNDIRRRLDLGHAGPKVRQVEDGVIDSLDKLIKDMESQQQQQQQSTDIADGIQSSGPAQDSYLRGGKGQGDVTKKNIGSNSGWGDLPPKEREEAMQQIGRDFPSHYRDAIEQYFRRLATEDNP
jgi:hypothetical protein